MPEESQIIAALRARARRAPGLITGIGDDAAVLRPGASGDWVICSDLSVEGVHFRSEWASYDLIGRKSLAVTLSDIAAMGARSRFALLSVALPPSAPEAAGELMRGIFDYAEAHDVAIIGGDTSASPGPLFIDTVAIGECAEGGAVTHAGARPGESIFVTGALGASALGLALLERGDSLESLSKESREAAIDRHLRPEPRLAFGAALGEARLATAMIDISDGLSTDLWHILEESGCGARLEASALPVAPQVKELAGHLGLDPLRLALDSGEEYELLFTAPHAARESLIALAASFNLPLTEIGETIATPGLELHRDGAVEAIRPGGYEHVI